MFHEEQHSDFDLKSVFFPVYFKVYFVMFSYCWNRNEMKYKPLKKVVLRNLFLLLNKVYFVAKAPEGAKDDVTTRVQLMT